MLFQTDIFFGIWRSYLPVASTSKEPGQITNFYYEMNNIASHGPTGGNGNFGSFAVARNAGIDDPGLEIDMCFRAPGEIFPPSYYNGPKTLYHMELPGNELKLVLNLLNTCTFQRLKFEVTDKEMNIYEYFDAADRPHMKICTDLVVVKPQGPKKQKRHKLVSNDFNHLLPLETSAAPNMPSYKSKAKLVFKGSAVDNR